jgi:hypothetical protein
LRLCSRARDHGSDHPLPGSGTVTDHPKKAWSKPELIVLVRGKLQEAVLTTCKYAGFGGPNVTPSDCTGLDGSNCNLKCTDYVAS